MRFAALLVIVLYLALWVAYAVDVWRRDRPQRMSKGWLHDPRRPRG